jgi:hypothetical protein
MDHKYFTMIHTQFILLPNQQGKYQILKLILVVNTLHSKNKAHTNLFRKGLSMLCVHNNHDDDLSYLICPKTLGLSTNVVVSMYPLLGLSSSSQKSHMVHI